MWKAPLAPIWLTYRLRGPNKEQSLTSAPRSQQSKRIDAGAHSSDVSVPLATAHVSPPPRLTTTRAQIAMAGSGCALERGNCPVDLEGHGDVLGPFRTDAIGS
eukprot:scaffold10094_cov128-Isochrysis_galbana.AAC.4